MSTFGSHDNGANALIKAALQAAKGAELRVGILEEKGSEKAEGSPDVTVADVATFNEFGLGVPERSFIRRWYDDQLEENKRKFRALQARVLRGEITQELAFKQLGLVFVGDIQKRISGGIPPENAESTVERKGSSVPLIDKGQLRSSVSFEVA